jgi:hypothetical protein
MKLINQRKQETKKGGIKIKVEMGKGEIKIKIEIGKQEPKQRA